MTDRAPHNPSFHPLNPLNDGGAGAFLPEPGISLRDWFAGQALAGLNAANKAAFEAYHSIAKKHGITINQVIVKLAFERADAMLAARKAAK